MDSESGEAVFSITYLDGDKETLKYVARAGVALATYGNGDTYQGEFSAARLRHGRGTYTWAFKSDEDEDEDEDAPKRTASYTGDYVRGKRHGVGRMMYPNGDEYYGEWVDNRAHGEGTYKYSNGDVYSGDWKRGVKEGRGTYVLRDTVSQLIGEWVAGRLRTGRWVFRDGSSFVGDFQDNKPSGRGVFRFASGTELEGRFLERFEGEEEEVRSVVWKADGAPRTWKK
eukprot:PLAT4772.1.p2 GENE.PLAT4772.1~~PLAT4772.1.p2  ORF type:complete len:250 (-),score=84.40 PLAT4772.1:70-750(-)